MNQSFINFMKAAVATKEAGTSPLSSSVGHGEKQKKKVIHVPTSIASLMAIKTAKKTPVNDGWLKSAESAFSFWENSEDDIWDKF